jgi:ATPase subunit of ABC transporter with duplicated ATPase domains
VASHDRYLIERVTDVVYGMFGDGRLVHLAGGVDEYLSRVDGDAVLSPPRPQPPPTAVKPASARDLKKEMARLERQVGKLEQRESQLHDELARHATDYAKVAELDGRLRAVQAERAQTEEAWLVLADRLPPD